MADTAFDVYRRLRKERMTQVVEQIVERVFLKRNVPYACTA